MSVDEPPLSDMPTAWHSSGGEDVGGAWWRRGPHVSSKAVVLGVLALAMALRLIFILSLVEDPAGRTPDAPIYEAIARTFYQEGFLADHPAVPEYPIGYPVLIALVYLVAWPSPHLVALVQTALLVAGSYILFRVVSREIGERAGVVAAAIMALHPVSIAASATVMYESVLAFLLIWSLDLVSRSRVDSSIRRGLGLVGAGLLMGAGVAIQAKTLPVVIFVVGIVALRSNWRWAAVVVVVVLVAPGLYMARNLVVHDRVALSTNLGANLFMGWNDRATGGYLADPSMEPKCAVSTEPFKADADMRRCAVRWVREHPWRIPDLVVRKTLYLWSPWIGPPANKGNFLPEFDVRRALPGGRDGQLVRRLDEPLRLTATLLTLLLLLVGARETYRLTPRAVWLFGIPVLLFTAVHWVTVGEPRYRFAVFPFYVPFFAVLLLRVWERLHPGGPHEAHG